MFRPILRHHQFQNLCVKHIEEGQRFVKNSCTKFHENPLDFSVADTRSVKDRQTRSVYKILFLFFVKNA
jgi:hypothetical protein